MRTIRDTADLAHIPNKDYVLTIGNFDGVHRGHQSLLSSIKAQARAQSLAVVTFIPHPSLMLHPKENFLINSYSERRELLASHGVDCLWELEFSRDFSTLPPEEFLERYILAFPNLKCVYLGHDFSFGANKRGNMECVKNVCAPRGVEVSVLPEHRPGSEQFSSTAVRGKINQGDMQGAARILGRPFFLAGRVIRGEGRGHKIGFPTANMEYDRARAIPLRGVYATMADYKGMVYRSVTNVGMNPTFKQDGVIHIETHILDFSNDIYGEELGVRFLGRIRDEMKFSSVNDLIAQIRKDAEVARHWGVK